MTEVASGRRPWIRYDILDDEATLRRLVEEGKSDSQIGLLANCEERSVAKFRLKFRIMRSKGGGQGPRVGIDYEILGKPDVLRRLYIDEGHTQEEIAAMAGCTPVVVGRWLRLFGIPARKRGEVAAVRLSARPVIREISREQLRLVVERAYGRARRCSPACPGWEDCLDDEEPCRMIRAA